MDERGEPGVLLPGEESSPDRPGMWSINAFTNAQTRYREGSVYDYKRQSLLSM